MKISSSESTFSKKKKPYNYMKQMKNKGTAKIFCICSLYKRIFPVAKYEYPPCPTFSTEPKFT